MGRQNIPLRHSQILKNCFYGAGQSVSDLWRSDVQRAEEMEIEVSIPHRANLHKSPKCMAIRVQTSPFLTVGRAKAVLESKSRR